MWLLLTFLPQVSVCPERPPSWDGPKVKGPSLLLLIEAPSDTLSYVTVLPCLSPQIPSSWHGAWHMAKEPNS